MPRNVIFVAPFPSETHLRFLRAAAGLQDVRLLGIVHTPPSEAHGKIFDDLVRVANPLSAQALMKAADSLKDKHGPIHRVIGILEHLQIQLAGVREHVGVAGTDVRTADLFRDKPRMKRALADAGLPVARNALIGSVEAGERFAAEVGFPLVLKPPAGMGAKATFRVSSLASLYGALRGMGVSHEAPMLAEELLQGREFSFETITLGGEPRTHSLSHYLPTCLEVLETPWIQWCCLFPRDISGPDYDGARELGFAAIRALGLGDGMTHMEWFQRTDGSLVIGEIAQRPPGANITLMTGLVHDIDPYRAWARAVVDGELDSPWVRRYAAGTAFLRGMGRGRVVALTGVAEANEQVGHMVAEVRLPTIGAPKSDHYEGDGYVVLRHEDEAEVRRGLKVLIQTVKVHYA